MEQSRCTFGEAMTAFAQKSPDEHVVILLKDSGEVARLSRIHLERWSNQLAHALIERGVVQGDLIPIVLPTSIEHIVATAAVLKAGGTPMPVNHKLPDTERSALIALAEPRAVIADPEIIDEALDPSESSLVGFTADTPMRRVSKPIKALSSGGSTGKPKLIITPGEFCFPMGEHPQALLLRFDADDLMYSPGPLYHNGPFIFSLVLLFHGGRIMLNERFRADRALAFIGQERPTVLNLVPTMMQRMLREPVWSSLDLSFLRHIWHLAAPCPAWAKEGFIDKLGGEKVLELWAATESTGLTVIDGNEWLDHRGSVGRGVFTEFKILDEARRELPPGEVGEIFSRFGGVSAAYEYRGAPALESTTDGFASVGDLGWIDEQGYLFLADRRTDLIISGGANIFPAEVEAVLSQHPAVGDVAVVGLSDPDLGRRVHAIMETAAIETAPDAAVMADFCADRLVRYKIPRSFEWVTKLPRNEAGKIRRKALREARET